MKSMEGGDTPKSDPLEDGAEGVAEAAPALLLSDLIGRRIDVFKKLKRARSQKTRSALMEEVERLKADLDAKKQNVSERLTRARSFRGRNELLSSIDRIDAEKKIIEYELNGGDRYELPESSHIRDRARENAERSMTEPELSDEEQQKAPENEPLEDNEPTMEGSPHNDPKSEEEKAELAPDEAVFEDEAEREARERRGDFMQDTEPETEEEATPETASVDDAESEPNESKAAPPDEEFVGPPLRDATWEEMDEPKEEVPPRAGVTIEGEAVRDRAPGTGHSGRGVGGPGGPRDPGRGDRGPRTPGGRGDAAPLPAEAQNIFSEYGLKEEVLRSIPGFNELSQGRQLLVAKNLQQAMYRQTTSEAKNALEQEKVEKKWSFRLKNAFTLGGYESGHLRTLEKKIHNGKEASSAGNKQVVNELVQAALKGPQAEIVEGRLALHFAQASEGATERERDSVARFNKAADDFARIPSGWSYESAERKNRAQYEEVRRAFERERSELLSLRAESLGEQEAALQMNALDEQIQINQLFTEHPKIDDALSDIKNQSAFMKGLTTTFNPIHGTGAYAGYGYLARYALMGTAIAGSTVVAPALAIGAIGVGLGAFSSLFKAREGVRRREEKGREGSQTRRQYVYHKKDASGAILAETGVRDINAYRDASFFTDRLNRLADQLEKADTEERKALLRNKIAQTVALAEERMERGMLSFKGARDAKAKERSGKSTEGKELTNKLDFVQSIGRGRTFMAHDVDAVRADIERRMNLRSATLRGLDKEEITKTVVKGAFIRGGLATAGALIAGLIHGGGPGGGGHGAETHGGGPSGPEDHISHGGGNTPPPTEGTPGGPGGGAHPGAETLGLYHPGASVGIVTVKEGDNLWDIIKGHLSVPGLKPAEQTDLISNIEQHIRANPQHFGISSNNVDQLVPGDKLNLGLVMDQKSIMNQLIGHAKGLSAAQIQSITQHNIDIAKWAAEHPGARLDTAQVNAIINGTAETVHHAAAVAPEHAGASGVAAATEHAPSAGGQTVEHLSRQEIIDRAQNLFDKDVLVVFHGANDPNWVTLKGSTIDQIMHAQSTGHASANVFGLQNPEAVQHAQELVARMTGASGVQPKGSETLEDYLNRAEYSRAMHGGVIAPEHVATPHRAPAQPEHHAPAQPEHHAAAQPRHAPAPQQEYSAEVQQQGQILSMTPEQISKLPADIQEFGYNAIANNVYQNQINQLFIEKGLFTDTPGLQNPDWLAIQPENAEYVMNAHMPQNYTSGYSYGNVGYNNYYGRSNLNINLGASSYGYQQNLVGIRNPEALGKIQTFLLNLRTQTEVPPLQGESVHDYIIRANKLYLEKIVRMDVEARSLRRE